MCNFVQLCDPEELGQLFVIYESDLVDARNKKVLQQSRQAARVVWRHSRDLITVNIQSKSLSKYVR